MNRYLHIKLLLIKLILTAFFTLGINAITFGGHKVWSDQKGELVIGATYTYCINDPIDNLIGEFGGGAHKFEDGVPTALDPGFTKDVASITPSSLTPGITYSFLYKGEEYFVEVINSPVPGITSATTGSMCSGLPVNYTITGTDGPYTWSRAEYGTPTAFNDVITPRGSWNNATNPINEVVVNVTAPPVDVDVIYYLKNPAGCVSTYTVTVGTGIPPTISSAATGNICSGIAQNYIITSDVPAATYSWTRAAVAGITPAVAGAGTSNPITETLGNTTAAPIIVEYLITPSNGGCDGAVFSYKVTVYPLPVVNPTVLDNTICFDETTTLDANATGVGVLSYSWDNATELNDPLSSTPTISPTLAGIILYTVTVTDNAAACVNTGNVSVTQNALPVVTLDIPLINEDVCIDEGTFALSGGVPGFGTYSGSGVAAGDFDPAAATAGVHVITYQFTDGNACTNSATDNITVHDLPLVSISNLDAIHCEGDPIDPFDYSPDWTAVGGTGVFTGVPAGITDNNNGTADYDPSATGLGSFTLVYTFTDANGCINTASANTKTGTELFFVDLDAQYCDNEGNFQFQYTPGATVNPGDGVTIAPVTAAFTDNGDGTADFNPSAAGANTYTFTYRYTDPDGCLNVITQDVIVSVAPTASIGGLNAAYCSNDANDAITGTPAPVAPATGVFSFLVAGLTDNGDGTATLSPSTVPAAGSPHDLTYTYTDALGCSDVSVIESVIINQAPTATISGTTTICEGNATNITTTFSSVSNYTYVITDGSSNYSFSVVGVGSDIQPFSPAINTTYTLVSVTDDVSGCTGTVAGSAVITVTPAVSITTQPTNNVACPGDNISYNVVAGGVNLSYAWEFDVAGAPVAFVAVGVNSASHPINGVAAGDAGDYRVTVSSATCGIPVLSNEVSLVVGNTTTITLQPTDIAACDGTSENLQVTATGDNLTYTWRENGVDINTLGDPNYVGDVTPVLTINSLDNTYDGNVYTCFVSGDCGVEASNPATLTVDNPIVITAQPTNKTACPGSNVNYTITATGTNLSYQWQEKVLVPPGAYADIGGAVGVNLVLNNIDAIAAGKTYRCKVYSPCGETVYSDDVSLTLYDEINITTQPADATVCETNPVNFQIVSDGSNLSYQWQYNNGGGYVNLVDAPLVRTGSTGASLTLLTTALADEGLYQCVITNNCGSTNSDAGTLTVDKAAVITTHPQDAVNCPLENTNLIVSATGTNLNYQWKFDAIGGGVIFVNVGVNSPIYNIPAFAVGDEGDYYCEITNDCGTVTSNTVTRTLGVTTNITTHPTGDTKCPTESISLSLVSNGSTLTYQWQKDGVDLVEGGDISGSTTDNVLISNLVAGDAGSYTCIVTGDCGIETSNPAVLIMNKAIAITTHPVDKTVCEAADIIFNVVATGTALSYQWKFDDGGGGPVVDLGTAANQAINNVATTDAGTYYCEVTNVCGIVNSNTANLQVNTTTIITTQPIDIASCEGSNESFSVVATGTNLSYEWYKNMVAIVPAQTNSVLDLTGVLAADAGSYTCIITGTCGVETSTPGVLTVDEAAVITSHPQNAVNCPLKNTNLSVAATGTDLSYQWKFDALGGGVVFVNVGVNSPVYNIPAFAAGDEGDYYCEITNDCGTIVSNTVTHTLGVTTNITTHPTGDTKCPTESISLSVVSNGSTLTYQWQKDGVDLVEGGDISGSTTDNVLINNLVAGNAGSYTCIVSGDCGTETSNPAVLIMNETIAFTTHPVDKTVCEAADIIFNVVATGTGLSYQWKFDDGSGGPVVDLGTAANQAVNNVATTDAGTYYCEVTNVCGIVNSNTANLQVNTTTVITTQPIDIASCEGSNESFSVVTTGTNLSYEWYKNMVAIVPAETNAVLDLTGVLAADAGSYTCIITGTCGVETSTPGTLTVDEAAVITSHPQDAVNCPLENTILSVAATGTNLSYQWKFDAIGGGVIFVNVGVNSPIYNIPAFAAGDEGDYYCEITNDCGTVISNTATRTLGITTNITTQPVDATVCEANAVNFQVVSDGSNLTYQWYKNPAIVLGDGLQANGTTSILGSNSNSINISNVNTTDDAGVYYCVITGTCGNVTSGNPTLIVNEGLTINTNPVSKTICPGANTSYVVNVSGDINSYQWQFNDGGGFLNLVNGAHISGSGSNVTGALTNTLFINGVATTDDGTYRCVIDGVCEDQNSNPAGLTVATTTSIITEPIAANLCEGEAAGFTVDATGTNLSYEWYKASQALPLSDGGSISGSNTNSLSITGLVLADADIYSCIVSGTCNNVTSIGVNLDVGEYLTINTQPTNKSACPGGTVSFNINVSGDIISYEWYKDGVLVTNPTVSGATAIGTNGPTLTITGVAALDAGDYTCRIVGDCDTRTSNAASLSVGVTTTSSDPVNITDCEGETVNISVTATGTNLIYQWYKDAVALVDGVQVSGSTFSGTSNPTLVIDNANPDDDGSYHCFVDGECTDITTNIAILTITPSTAITLHPSDYSVLDGGNATFTITAEGDIATYEWYKDGVAIPLGGDARITGENSPSITITGVIDGTDNGDYHCVVTGNACGNTSSNTSTLTILLATSVTTQPPVNTTKCQGEDLLLSIITTGGPHTYEWQFDDGSGYVPLADAVQAHGSTISGSTTTSLNITNIQPEDEGFYICVLNGGTDATNSALVNVVETITINTHSTNKERCDGEPVTFSISASGGINQYQWFNSLGPIAGANSSSYTIAAVVAGDAGNYFCVVEAPGTCADITSNSAQLTVNDITVLNSGPADKLLCEGDNTLLTADVSGSNLTYQWYFNSAPLADGGSIGGSQEKDLVISGALTTDDGNYYCEIQGSCGNETTVPVDINIDPTTTITTQPISRSKCIGDQVQFVVAANGEDLTYQWRFNDGSGYVDLAGETNTTLTINPITALNDGNYYCEITSGNGCGDIDSDAATLTVHESTVLVGSPVDETLCEGASTTLTANVTGGNLTYTWLKDNIPLVNGVNISGVNTRDLEISNATLTESGIYQCNISGFCGAAVSTTPATITIDPTTTITTQPVDGEICVGDSKLFIVIADGLDLTYQWYYNAGLMGGETNSQLSIDPVALTDDGVYTCLVSSNNGCGDVLSSPATITVHEATTINSNPVDRIKCQGTTTTFTVNADGGNLQYQWIKDGVTILSDVGNISGTNTKDLLITGISLADDGVYTCEVSGFCNNLTSDPAFLTVDPTTTITSSPTSSTKCEEESVTFYTAATGANLTYQWQKGTTDLNDGIQASGSTVSNSTKSALTITNINILDAGSYRCIVTGNCGIQNTDPAILNVNYNTLITSQPTGNTICAGAPYTFSITADGDNLTYQWKKNGTDIIDGGNISGATTENLFIINSTLSNAGAYTCLISGVCGSENSIIAQLDIEPITNIILQPINTTACTGDNINFSVSADGANLIYKWQKDGVFLNDIGNISGSASSLLTVSNVSNTDNGSYRCIVSGNCGISNSDPATFSVYSNTLITSQPTGNTVCETDQITLSITATGDILTYQWKKDGVILNDGANISGTTAPDLIINNSLTTNSGVYTCDVIGACGAENSSPANVIVNGNASVLTQPKNIITCEGDVAVFTVTAAGTGLTYKWQKNGTPLTDGGNILGSSSPVLTINNLTPTEAGTYRCVISSLCNSLNSDGADLTVNSYPSAAGVILGPSEVCQGDNNIIYEIDAITNADTYIWELPVGVSIISGDGTRLIKVAFSENELGGNITVRGNNSCGPGSVSPVLIVTANPVPSALAGPDQNLCTDNTSLEAIHPGTAIGIWSIKDGPAIVQNVNLHNSPVTNLREGTNTLIWTVSKSGCSSSDTVIIKNNFVSVEAGTNTTICIDSIQLEGSTVPVGATGSWSAITGAANFVNGNNPTTIASGFAPDQNILRWTISNNGCVFYDSIIIDNQKPTVAYAGIDQSICSISGTLNGNTPSIGTGTWTVTTGSATFSDINDSKTAFTNLGIGNNILRWTISKGICSSIDEITISNNMVNVNAGIDQVICDRTTTLEADEPLTETGNWSVASGSAVFVNNKLHNTIVTGLAEGVNELIWNLNYNSCISSDTVSITNDSPTKADAGPDQIINVDFTTLQGNIPTKGVGTWSLISGSATIVNTNLNNTNVTGLALGENIFRWTTVNNSCISYDDVTITNASTSATDAGEDRSICSDATELDGSEPAFGFGEWSVIQGSAIFADASDPKTAVTNLTKGNNTLRWSIWENGWESDDVIISNDSPTSANAGSDQNVCADSTYLSANNPIIGTGKWTILNGSGIFENDTIYNTKVSSLTKGDNVFKWTITNKSCSSSALVTITNNLPSESYAGEDQTICTSTITLSPNTPSIGVGEWSVVSGSANFDGNNISKLASGPNTLRWSIVNNGCTTHNDIVITNNEPSNANAGADKTICYDSLTLAASTPVIGSGIWSAQSGSASIADIYNPTSTVTNINQGINAFRWTVSYMGCTKYDEVVITNAYVQATTGIDQNICDKSTVLEANNPADGFGTWSVLGGSGSAIFENASQPDTRVSGLDQGENILRWTIVNDICISYSDVSITNNLPTESFAGADQSLCVDTTILQANNPLIGTGQWSILSGSANIDASNNPISSIKELGFGVNTLRWTITNNGCISTDEVIILNNSAITSIAGIDQVICADSSELHANDPAFGTGYWSVVSGSATFYDQNNYKTKVKNLNQGQNTLRWVISNGTCSTSDELTITNNSPTHAIAGADQIVCGNTTNLQANIPTIGTGQWSLISGSVVFNDNTFNNTSVTDLNAGTNTLRWTITNQECSSYDDVVITNDLPYEANAGSDFTVCNDQANLYANDPVSGIGQWTVISGSGTFTNPSLFDTEVTGLGFGANTLRWKVTYENCTTYDELIVTNDKINVNAGTDQEVNTSSTLLTASNPSSGTGIWTVIGGSGVFVDPSNSVTLVESLGSGLNTFRWSVDVNGCVSNDDVSITYNAPPDVSFVVTDTDGCPPHEVYFVNNTLDYSSFIWNFDDGTSSDQITIKHTYSESGVYKPSLTIIGINDEIVVKDTTITVYNQPEASFLVVNKQVYIPEEEAVFINNSNHASTYRWEFGDGGESTDSDPRYIYETEGIYDIILHAWSEYDCYDSTIVIAGIKVFDSGTIIFPNAFSPNLDGPSGGVYDPNDFSNDVFYPIGEGIEDFHLEVFNRWGILVFESNDIYIGWDGYYDNKLLGEGVYVWKASGKYNNGKEFKKVGTVLLLH